MYFLFIYNIHPSLSWESLEILLKTFSTLNIVPKGKTIAMRDFNIPFHNYNLSDGGCFSTWYQSVQYS